MKKDTGKSKKQLLAEVEELRRISSEQEEKLNASNQQLIQTKVKNIFEDPETFRKKVFAAYDREFCLIL